MRRDAYLPFARVTTKSKAGKHSAVAEWFRFRSLSLFSLGFLKSHLALFPFSLPAREAPVESILEEEFGLEISDQLLSPPSPK